MENKQMLEEFLELVLEIPLHVKRPVLRDRRKAGTGPLRCPPQTDLTV